MKRGLVRVRVRFPDAIDGLIDTVPHWLSINACEPFNSGIGVTELHVLDTLSKTKLGA